jgi:predicted nucleic acid-binding protein
MMIESDLGPRVVQAGDEDRRRARERFQKLSGVSLSLTDCTSFALTSRSGIQAAATFDAGFRGDPDPIRPSVP